MAVPLRLIDNDQDSHPLIIRLCRYVALTDEEIASLRAAFECRLSVAKKRDLMLEGYELHKLHVVLSGFAARYKLLADGRRQVLSIILAGDIIGMPSAFFHSSLYSVTALTDMTVEVIPLEEFLKLCRKIPSLAIAMLWYTEDELASYADRIVDIGRRSPLERVAHFVLELHARLRTAGSAAERGFDMPLSQEIIGDLLGLSAPHVNRMLHQLRAERLISVDRRRVTIEDPEGLQMLAQFEPLSPLASARTAR